MSGKTAKETKSVRGNKRLDEILARPEIGAKVEKVKAESREMDRVFAMNLAMIRKAGDLTQVEVAEKLGVGQGVVSRLERRSDMLLSTLADYLLATGAENARIVITVKGTEVELDLTHLRNENRAG